MCHRQSNDQGETVNKQILNALKKKLDDLKGAWVDMVLTVLWSNRTTEKEATEEIPFRSTFDTEVVQQVKVGLPNWRILNYDPELNSRLHKGLGPLTLNKASCRAQVSRIQGLDNQGLQQREYEAGR